MCKVLRTRLEYLEFVNLINIFKMSYYSDLTTFSMLETHIETFKKCVYNTDANLLTFILIIHINAGISYTISSMRELWIVV